MLYYLLSILLGAVASLSEPPTLILAADNGTFSGMSELHYIELAVTNATAVVDLVHCRSALTGVLATSSGPLAVILATTGIGSVAAALCTDEIISKFECASHIFVGTSGASPVVGGFQPTQPYGCDAISGAATVGVGSVCITSKAISMFCGVCTSDALAAPTECRRPNCEAHDDATLFGDCSYNVSSSLAENIKKATATLVLPNITNKTLVQFVDSWWKSHKAVIGESPPLAPRIFEQCVEADAHQIWVGGPLDYLCREYTASELSLNAGKVACVTAMESTGFLRAVSLRRPNTPTAVVRGVSNMNMYPLYLLPTGWVQNTTFVTQSEYQAGMKSGYQFAVKTSNYVILHFLGVRPNF